MCVNRWISTKITQWKIFRPWERILRGLFARADKCRDFMRMGGEGKWEITGFYAEEQKTEEGNGVVSGTGWDKGGCHTVYKEESCWRYYNMHSINGGWTLFRKSWLSGWLYQWGKWRMDKIRSYFVTCTWEKCVCKFDKGISEGGKMLLRIWQNHFGGRKNAFANLTKPFRKAEKCLCEFDRTISEGGKMPLRIWQNHFGERKNAFAKLTEPFRRAEKCLCEFD